MTVRDVLYNNEIDICADIIIGVPRNNNLKEYNASKREDRDALDEYLDEDITYITIRNTKTHPYIYMEILDRVEY